MPNFTVRRRWCRAFKRWRVRGQGNEFGSVSIRPKPSIDVFREFYIFHTWCQFSFNLSLFYLHFLIFFIYLILLAACCKSKITYCKWCCTVILVELFLTFNSLSRENLLKWKMWVPLPRVTYTWKLMGQWAFGWDFSPFISLVLEYLWVWILLTLFFVLTLTAFILTVVPASVRL